MRSKEEAADYRYFPDPDLPPMVIKQDWLDAIRARTPELPEVKRKRYLELGLRPYDANQLAYDVELARFFDALSQTYQGEAQTLSNWLLGDISGYLNANNLSLGESRLSPAHLVSLLKLIDQSTISGKTAKALLPEVMQGADPVKLVEERQLGQISDAGALESLVDSVITANPELVERVKANPKAINALLGLVMKERATAKPDAIRDLLSQKLGV
jgi:aspartyl-tRNA(Asn)/glutamyl-tRNA(Gln) amidotransferase subunit B